MHICMLLHQTRSLCPDAGVVVQFPPRGFWELQFRQTHGRGDGHEWRPYAQRLKETSVAVKGLVPGTSYDFRARGGFEGMGDVTMGDFSVTATVVTTGKRPVAAASPAAAASAAGPHATPRTAGKTPAKPARSASDAVKDGNEPVRSDL